jgi:hypothetical protein
MSKAKTVTRPVADLRPHPLHRDLYGPPTANSAYKDIKSNMRARGFDERQFLLVTGDGRILWGVTRWAVARSLNIEEVPCEVFVPSSPERAELEIEAEIVRGNMYRVKDQLTIAREQRKLLEVEAHLARQRMGGGGDDGPSKSTDRVGKVFRVSGKTVQRQIKVLEAIEKAEAGGDHRRAEKLTNMLNAGQTVKALEVIAGKPSAPRKPPAVDVPRTLLDHLNKAHSEFYEACAKATVPAEVDLVASYLDKMNNVLEQRRLKVAAG